VRISGLFALGLLVASGCDEVLRASSEQARALQKINAIGVHAESNDGYRSLIGYFRAAGVGCRGKDALVGAKAAQAVAQYQMNGYPVPASDARQVEAYLSDCSTSSHRELVAGALIGLGMLDKPKSVRNAWEASGRRDQLAPTAALALGFACDPSALVHLERISKYVKPSDSHVVREAERNFQRSRARCSSRASESKKKGRSDLPRIT
jgi:hypothetical protein